MQVGDIAYKARSYSRDAFESHGSSRRKKDSSSGVEETKQLSGRLHDRSTTIADREQPKRLWSSRQGCEETWHNVIVRFDESQANLSP